MDKEERKEELENDFVAFAQDFPNTALSLVTGLFVGLLEHNVEANGGDKSQDIVVEGGGSRNITVHAVPNTPNLC